MVRAGKALYIGASSMYAWQFLKMLQTSDIMGLRAVCDHAEPLQPGLPGGRAGDDSALPGGRCGDDSLESAGAWFSSRKPESESRGETVRAKTDDFAHNLYYRPSDFNVVERLSEIASKAGSSECANCPGMDTGKPGVTSPIIGASKMPHLDQALAALDIRLNESEIKALEEPYEPHPVLGF